MFSLTFPAGVVSIITATPEGTNFRRRLTKATLTMEGQQWLATSYSLKCFHATHTCFVCCLPSVQPMQRMCAHWDYALTGSLVAASLDRSFRSGRLFFWLRGDRSRMEPQVHGRDFPMSMSTFRNRVIKLVAVDPNPPETHEEKFHRFLEAVAMGCSDNIGGIMPVESVIDTTISQRWTLGERGCDDA